MKFYHATSADNVSSINASGLKAGWDGVVYLCDAPAYAIKFAAIHLVPHIAVYEVDIPKKSVRRSFDHNESFFQCKAYTHDGDIGPDRVKLYQEVNLKDWFGGKR